MADVLKFEPLTGSVDVGFLTELAKKKLEEFKLSDAPVPIRGGFTGAARRDASSPFCVAADAFAPPASSVPPSLCVAPGTLLNANTLEDFKEMDKAAVLEREAAALWEAITSGRAYDEPATLLRFALLSFADLKTHKFYYWFAFPSLALNPPPRADAPAALADVLDSAQILQLREGYAALPRAADGGAPPFFAVRRAGGGAPLAVGPLSKFREWAAEADAAVAGDEAWQAWLAVSDPCAAATHPGWPLRNLLALVAQQPPTGVSKVTVLCYREAPPGAAVDAATAAPSLVVDVTLPPPAAERPNAVGWAKNAAGKLGARMMDLSRQMRPEALAEASVDLNLQLMRWRLMPQLNNEAVAGTRCLLLGAGTLGCSVARCLLGWGVRKITLVDSGVVSYSNPVRQSLFSFADCVDGQTPKAEAAAKALRAIFPSVDASSRRLAIPMPGHPVTGEAELAQVKSDCDELASLVDSHDVVFLLTDTRESRWLPSLLAAAKGKLALTAALGFDSFLVMRHGPPPPPPDAEPAAAADVAADGAVPIARFDGSGRLGCYFCNDVVAPANSMLRRTLDQQCTVSRPGLQMLASALAVELMVTLLHHPKGIDAPADDPAAAAAAGGGGAAAEASPLGTCPHQIRGTLPFFRNDVMHGRAFDRCTACSATVVREYEARGFEFLLSAFNRGTYLEDLTGLTQMHKEAEAALEAIDAFDDDDEWEET